MGDDGKITQVVISTGGLLGIGGKLVSVPYDQIKLEPSAGNARTPGHHGGQQRSGRRQCSGGFERTGRGRHQRCEAGLLQRGAAGCDQGLANKQQSFKYASTD